METRKVKLRTLNPHITCYICKGYLIDATTVIECLHTFCRSCLLKHFESNNCCPKCESLIHQSHPAHYVSFDRTMQDMVFKLVPNLQEKERKRREKFFKERGINYEEAGQTPSFEPTSPSSENHPSPTKGDGNYHRDDEQAGIILTYERTGLKKLKRQYIRCSTNVTILHLRKYIALKLFTDQKRFREIDILCNNELMGKDHTVKFILLTRWRSKIDEPLELQYRKHVDF